MVYRFTLTARWGCTAVAALLALAGCDGLQEEIYEIRLANSEFKLQRFVLATDDTTDLEDPNLVNYMDLVLEHHATEPEVCESRTFFEDGGRAVSYYYHRDTLHHVATGRWEMRGPDEAYFLLSAQFQSGDTIAVANGVFRILPLGNRRYAIESQDSRISLFNNQSIRQRFEVELQ